MSVAEKVTKIVEGKQTDIEACEDNFYRLSIPLSDLTEDKDANAMEIGNEVYDTLKGVCAKRLVLEGFRGMLIYFPFADPSIRCFQIFLKAKWNGN